MLLKFVQGRRSDVNLAEINAKGNISLIFIETNTNSFDYQDKLGNNFTFFYKIWHCFKIKFLLANLCELQIDHLYTTS